MSLEALLLSLLSAGGAAQGRGLADGRGKARVWRGWDYLPDTQGPGVEDMEVAAAAMDSLPRGLKCAGEGHPFPV